MDPLELKTAQLSRLSNEERAKLYSVVRSDLILEKQVMRNTSQLQVLFCNPYYFFGGSHVVKAWLDATASSTLRDTHVHQESFENVKYAFQSHDQENRLAVHGTEHKLSQARYSTLTKKRSSSIQREMSPNAAIESEPKTAGNSTLSNTYSFQSHSQFWDNSAGDGERLKRVTFSHPTEDSSTMLVDGEQLRGLSASAVSSQDLTGIGSAGNSLDIEEAHYDERDGKDLVSGWTTHSQQMHQEPQVIVEIEHLSMEENKLPGVTVWNAHGTQAVQTVGDIQVIPYTPHESDVPVAYQDEREHGDEPNKVTVKDFRISSESISISDSEIESLGALRKHSGDSRGSGLSQSLSRSSSQLSPSPQDSYRAVSSPTASPRITRTFSKYKLVHKTHQDQITLVNISRPHKGKYQISGAVSVKIMFDEDTLFVTIVEARNLAATDKKGSSNPYVKLHLLPDLRSTKRKTKVDKKTLSPFFNQTFQYPLAKEDIGSRAVWVTVWSKNKWQSVFLGETCISLTSINLTRATFRRWLRLWDYSDVYSDSKHISLATDFPPAH